MANYILKCRKCRQEIDLGKKINEMNIQCPNCGQTIVVPPHLRAKSKKGIITFSVILTLLLLGGGGYLLKMHEDQLEAKRLAEFQQMKEREAENEKLEAAKQQAEKERTALWVKIVNLCDEKKLKSSKDFEHAFAALRKYKNICTNYEDRQRVDEYKNLLEESKTKALNAVYDNLEKEVAPLVQSKKFTQCAQIYTEYNGPFAEETSAKRRNIAAQYKNQAIAIKSEERDQQQQMAKAKATMLPTVSNFLINRKFKSAYNEFQNFPYKDSAPELNTILDDLLHLPNVVMNSFKNDQGKTVRVYLKSGPLDLEVVKVEGDTLTSKYKKDKIVMLKKIKYSDLSLQEVTKRVAKTNKEVANLYYGLNLLTFKKFDEAEKCFKNTGILSQSLLNELQTVRKQRTSESTIKATASTANINPDDVPLERIKIESAKVYIGTRKRELTSWGSNQRMQNILITLRNGTGVPVSTGTMDFYVIGEGVVHEDTYQIIHTISKPLNMTRIGKMTIKDEFLNEYDDGGLYKYGHKYYSWILAIRDKNGKIKVLKAKHSKFEHAADKILELATKTNKNGKHAPQFDETGKILNIKTRASY